MHRLNIFITVNSAGLDCSRMAVQTSWSVNPSTLLKIEDLKEFLLICVLLTDNYYSIREK
jgi:hypothetical protein